MSKKKAIIFFEYDKREQTGRPPGKRIIVVIRTHGLQINSSEF